MTYGAVWNSARRRIASASTGTWRWVLAGLLVTALAAGTLYRPGQVAAATIIGTPTPYNLQATSFNFGWYTDSTTVGSIVVHSASDCSDTGTAYPEFAADGYVHFSASVAAAAGTTYHVSVLINGVATGCYSVKTLATGAAPASSPTVGGTITYPQPTCAVGASGVLAWATLTNGATAAASPLGVISSAGGSYSLNLGSARSADGSPFPLISGATSVTLHANASAIADASQLSYTYTGSNVENLCLPTIPIEPGTPTATATGTPTITPVGFVTSTPIATLTPSITPTPTTTSTPTTTATATITNTPIPTNTLIPFPFPTGTPPSLPPPPPPGVATSTSTPAVTPTFTATPVPSPGPPPPPKPVKLKAWTRIHAKTVHPDGQQSVEVHTLAGASVAMKVVYPDKASSYSASGKANKQGVWTARWTVLALQRGRASVTFTVRFGKQKKVLHRYFSVR